MDKESIPSSHSAWSRRIDKFAGRRQRLSGNVRNHGVGAGELVRTKPAVRQLRCIALLAIYCFGLAAFESEE